MSDQDKLTQALEAEQVKVKELTKALDERAPEAIYAFSAKFNKGAVKDAMFTIRARPGEDGKAFLFRVDAMTKHLAEHGWGDGVETTPVPPAPSDTPESGTTYEAHAVLMEVGESYKGNKPQLSFHCDGIEDPLKLTSRDTGTSDLIVALQRVGKYLPEQLVKGKKYTVDYLIQWTPSKPDAKGRVWKNIVNILPNK